MPRPTVSAERIPQILQAALRVFARQGFPAARMQDIAAEAGLSVGILYHYFENKDTLVRALLEELFRPDMARLEQLALAQGSVRERLWQYIETSWFAEANWVPLSLELRAMSARYPAIHAQLQAYEQRYLEGLAALVAKGIAAGELRSADPQTIALTILAWYDGMLENLPCSMPVRNEQTWRRALRQSFDLLFEGLAKPG
ncbi:MAG: hypothetical protein DDG60_05335 [Anaerolineae bacterium]|nr:MAG: hypothetical protein DDG60_05335 [Anaerolineae bacterium]